MGKYTIDELKKNHQRLEEIKEAFSSAKRVVIVGCPGSGKSRLSRILSKLYQLPVVHLDALFWNSDKTVKTKAEFDSLLQKELDKDNWIIEGNYARTMERRVMAADLVIYLSYPLEQCLLGANERIGTIRDDLPWVEQSLDPEFEQYIIDFQKDGNQQIEDLLIRYEDKNIVLLKNRAEADWIITQLENEIKKN